MIQDRTLQSGFSLVEFLISLFVFTLVLMGVFNLVAVNLIDLQLARNQSQLEGVTDSELQALVATSQCNPLDALLEVCADPDCVPKYKEVILNGRTVTCEWKTFEEDVSDSTAVTLYRIEMYSYFADNPFKTKKYVATKLCAGE